MLIDWFFANKLKRAYLAIWVAGVAAGRPAEKDNAITAEAVPPTNGVSAERIRVREVRCRRC